jgi:hypothetical protein
VVLFIFSHWPFLPFYSSPSFHGLPPYPVWAFHSQSSSSWCYCGQLHGLNNLISTNLFRDTKIFSSCVVMVNIIHSSCMLSFIHIYTKTQASKSTCSKFVFLECPQFVVKCTPCLFPSFWNPVLIDKPSSKVRIHYIHHLFSYSCIYPMQSRRLILLPSSILWVWIRSEWSDWCGLLGLVPIPYEQKFHYSLAVGKLSYL